MAELKAVLSAYEAALNEPDHGRRVALAESALSEDARLFSAHLPPGPPLDRAGFVADCGRVIGWRPAGARLRLRGGTDAHHGWVRFAWEVSGPDGEPIEVKGIRIEGIDVAELAPDGRFRTVVMFHGLVPPDTTE